MKANGFEFDYAFSAIQDPVLYDPVAEFGSPEQAVEVVGTGLIYGTIQSLTAPTEVEVDLLPAEYEATLWESATWEGETVVGGCAAWAQQTAQLDPSVQIASEMVALRAEYTGFDVRNHPQVVESWLVWSDCMARHGFPELADRGAMIEMVTEWKSEAVSNAETPTELVDALEELLPADKAIARADLECSEVSDVYMVSQRIADEQEAEFIAIHRDMIEELAKRKGLETPRR